jgi:uncharacterized protein
MIAPRRAMGPAVLIRFEVANFRSILDAVELSMIAVDRDRKEARPIKNLGESLLPVAAIYGPNASGKSNVLAALTWLRTAVEQSLRFWDDEIPVDSFAFADGPDRVSEFTVEAVIDGVRFEYAVDLDRAAVRYEGLFHYPSRRRRLIFEREDDDLQLQRGLGHLSGTRELLTARTLALSIARRFDEPLVGRFARALLDARVLGLSTTGTRSPSADGMSSTLLRFDEVDDDSSGARATALAMLRLADLGIDDVKIDRRLSVSLSKEDPRPNRTIRTIRLMHRTGASTSVPLPLNAESVGTRTWLELIGPVLDVLETGSLLLFDELDASLHPTLSAELLRLFHDPTTNPRGAQLIFTSHDTSLLNHLNRDEVWLTEKDDRGATRLGALAEFAGERVRKAQNLERAYLHGRFGSLPDLDRVEMLRALGLVG